MPDYDGGVIIKVDADTGSAEKEIKELSGDLEGAVGGASKLADKLKAGFATAAKVGVAAAAAAASGVAALTGAAVSAYGEYEQLVGGVDTLFKDSADTVIEYAANAYKTAGLSANEYMETVTSFSASLLQSLGGDTEQAAQMADMAITDMSDNVNKMGSSMESIQNAYNGFAKQNFTMLDNLKLGYGGTKEEMERLLADAEKLSGIKYDVSSYSDIVSAIHVVQTEIGITGTTALEASTTIQGSVSSMKSAWENLVTGLADENADLDTLINNFLESAVTVGENIVPVVETTLSAAGRLIAELAPKIGADLPDLVMQVLPSLAAAGVQLIQGIAQGMTTAIPQLWSAISELDIVGVISNMLQGAGERLREHLPDFISVALDMVSGLASSIRENAGILVDGAISLAKDFAQGLADSFPVIIEKAPQIVSDLANTINDNAPKLLAAAGDIIMTLGKGLVDAIPALVKNIPQIIKAVVDVFLAFNWLNIGKSIITGLGNGLKSMLSFLKEIGNQLVEAIKGGVSALPKAMLDIGKNIVSGLWNGINAMKDWALSKISGFVGGIVGGIKNLLGIHSPSTVFAEIGENVSRGLANGIQAEAGLVNSTINGVAQRLSGTKIGSPAWAPSLPSISPQQVPAIARGAVIPPNREFMAVLEGQRDGNNLEAPADLIRQMIIEGINAAGVSAGNDRPIQVNVLLDGKLVARNTVHHINDMTRQAGKPVLLL